MAGKTPVLVMLQGDEPGTRWKLQETRVTTIGRSSRNEISLVHPAISRFHCEVSYINGLWYIADLNSRKGTVLNGEPVKDRDVLRPGDIIRLSKNVFKFDMIDETAKDDEAMMAIRDAALDAKTAKGDDGHSLDDMRMRSQLSEEEEEEAAPPRISRKLLIDVGVIVCAAVVVAVAVGVLLNVMRRKSDAANQLKAQWLKDARQDLAKAVELKNTGSARLADAKTALGEVAVKYPGTEEAVVAAKEFWKLEGALLETQMGQIAAAERDRDFRTALACADSLQKSMSDPTLQEVVKERQEFTERLANVTFDSIRKEGQRLLDDGKVEEAKALFGKTVATIGVPRLEQQARFYLGQIRDKGAGGDLLLQPPKTETPATEPKTEPAPKVAPKAEPTKPPEPPPVPEEDIENKLKPLGTGENTKVPPPPPPTPDTEPKEPKKKDKKKDEGKKDDAPPSDDIEENFRPPVNLR